MQFNNSSQIPIASAKVIILLLLAIILQLWSTVPALAIETKTSHAEKTTGSESLSVEFKEGLFSVHSREASLGDILAAIEKQSGFSISIDEGLKTKPVTVSFSGLDIIKSLRMITNAAGLGGYGLSYRSTSTPGKAGQWVVDRIVLVDKGSSPDVAGGAGHKQKDKSQGGEIARKQKTIEKEPYFDKRLNRYVEVVKGEVLIRFLSTFLDGRGKGEGEQKGISDEISKFNKEKGTQTLKSYEKINAHRLKIPTTETVQEFIERHLIDVKQVYIEPIFLTHQQAILANDPSFKYQWAIPVIQADKAWEVNSGSSDTIVAVIDTGIDITHPDLKNNVISGIDIVNGNSNGIDDNGHGTYVAGIIAAEANNSIGIAGVSYKSRLMPVKVLSVSGEGSYADLIEGIIYAVDHRARILNLSLGGYSYSQFLGDAVQYAHSSRAVIVTAGGNENTDEQLYPAAYPNVIAVSATDPSDQRWTSSNYGSYIKLSAPGVGVLSTLKNDGYGEATGTSVSTAHVSGVAALIVSKNPDFSNTQVESILYQTADDLGDKGWDSYYGFGRVNTLKAIEKAGIEIHDVAIAGIRVEPETFKVGEATKIIVMVENQGTFVERNILVKISVNGDLIDGEQIIPIINPGDKLDIGFDWVAIVDKETDISAEASVIIDEDLSDNKSGRKVYLVEGNGVITIKYAISTHRWLTYEAVYFLGRKVDNSIFNELNANLNKLKDGAEHEDCAGYNVPLIIYSPTGLPLPNPAYSSLCANNPIDKDYRYMRHFYRPVDNKGYYDNLGLERDINGNRIYQHDNSYVWGSKQIDNSYNWVKTISKYKSGQKSEAYFSLGHVLHLIEDASLPEHTHLEAHGDFGFIIQQLGYEKYVGEKTIDDATGAFSFPFPGVNDDIVIYNNLESYFVELARLSYYRNRFKGDLPQNPTVWSSPNGDLAQMFPSLHYDLYGNWTITSERVNLAEEATWSSPYDTFDDWWETNQFDNNWGELPGFYYIEQSNNVKPLYDKGKKFGGFWDPHRPDGANDQYVATDGTKTLADLMAEDLIPHAIKHVAGSIMLFWNEIHLGEGEPADPYKFNDPTIRQKFINVYNAHGGAAKIGYPINFVHDWGGYWVQDFRPITGTTGFGDSIMIYNPDVDSVYIVHGDIWKQVYESMGGPGSWLGPPISNEYDHPTYGTAQDFKNGYITHKDDGGYWWEAYKYDSAATLNVSITGSGTVNLNAPGNNCTTNCSQDYTTGTLVTLTASANTSAGYYFVGWSGDCVGSSSTCTLNMSTNRNVGATFALSSVKPTSISVTINLNPSTTTPFSTVNVSGKATYNTGSPVTSGTAIIDVLGFSTYTAPLDSGGNYSRDITAPDSSRYIYVTVTDGILPASENQAFLTITGGTTNNLYAFDRSTTSKGMQTDDPWNPINETDFFRSSDSGVYVWFRLTDIFLDNHNGSYIQPRFEWYRPNGTLYTSYDGQKINDPGYGSYYPSLQFWSSLPISGYDVSDTEGRWSVKIYIFNGNAWEYKATESFIIRYEFAEHKMAHGVQSIDPWEPIYPTNIFYTTYARAYTWARANDVTEGFDVKWEWYEPNGSLYKTSYHTAKDPKTSGYDYWEWYKFWDNIDINGASAGNKAGDWLVKYYIKDPFGNWDLEYTDNFKIIEDPSTKPSIAVILTPSSPTNQDPLTLNVIAGDNTYLKRVILYWNDGTLRSQTWDNIFSSSFTRSQNIGTYPAGTTIEFYAVAYDTSDNVQESERRSVTIVQSIIREPIQLSQTGQTTCYDSAGRVISCTGTGQDGDIQAGIPWPSHRFTDNGNGTVTDNLTGLMWTKDANLMAIRDPGFDSDGTIGDGAVTWQHALDYIKKLNAEEYLGYTDWHLPNANEIESLVNAERLDTATWLNTQEFRNVQSLYYWSSTSSADNQVNAWVLVMWNGFMHTFDKSMDRYSFVWPVRSGQFGAIQLPKTGQTTCYDDAANIACTKTGQDGDIRAGVRWASPRFTISGNCVIDNLTGLMWTKDANLIKSISPAIDIDGTSGDGRVTLQHALDYANALNLCGFTDWRLPNRKELRSLIDFSQYNPTLPAVHPFLNLQSDFYWSSTNFILHSSDAWVVNLNSGDDGGGHKSGDYNNYYYIWPVRGGLTSDTTPPYNGSIKINNGSNYTNTTFVTLTLSATDNVGVTGYYVLENSITPSASAYGWTSVTSTTSYNASVPYTLSSGDGTKIVYVWYKDADENISDVASASIILDTKAIDDPDGDGFTNQDEVTARSDPYNPDSIPQATSIHLYPGFNLVSIPAELLYMNTAYNLIPVLGNVQEIERVLHFNNADGRYEEAAYQAGNILTGTDFINRNGMTLIIYSKVEKVVTFTSKVCPTWDLYAGLNLVGTPCASPGFTAFRLLQALGGETAVSSIQRFNLATGQFETAVYHKGQPTGVDFLIVPGEGYLIHMKKERLGFRP